MCSAVRVGLPDCTLGSERAWGALCLDLEREVLSPLAWRRRKGVFLLRISVSFLAEVFSCLPPLPPRPFLARCWGGGHKCI